MLARERCRCRDAAQLGGGVAPAAGDRERTRGGCRVGGGCQSEPGPTGLTQCAGSPGSSTGTSVDLGAPLLGPHQARPPRPGRRGLSCRGGTRRRRRLLRRRSHDWAGGASSTTSAAPARPAGCSATTGWPSSTCRRTATSRSPVGEAGRWLIYNGEIYNYRELRAELEALGHEFATETDTEVVAAVLRRVGHRLLLALQRHVGARRVRRRTRRRSFSRAIASASSRSTTTTVRTAFLFGSELKFLAGLIDLGLDETAAAEYLAESRIDHRPETLHPEVRQLPPGHLAEYDYADASTCAWRPTGGSIGDGRRDTPGAAPGGRGVHRAVRLRRSTCGCGATCPWAASSAEASTARR